VIRSSRFGVSSVLLLCASAALAEPAVQPPSAATDGVAPPPPAAAPAIEPPRVLEQVPPAYPASGNGQEPTVALIVTIDETGTVTEVAVAQSVSSDFDAAAADAVRRWRFEPARRDGQPVSSRVTVPVAFRAPAAAPPTPVPESTAPRPAVSAAPVTQAPPAVAPERPAQRPPPSTAGDVAEVEVSGTRKARGEDRSASDFAVPSEVLHAAPRKEGAEVLRAVPGLHLSSSEGPAVAHGYTLRGFDAEHGQDIAFSVGGIPINLPSHLHAQGYADLGFLIADTVDEVHATEGLSDPRQGDFAVAGSIDVSLGVDEPHRGVRLRSGYGSFDTYRQLVMWAPKQSQRESFAAAEFTRTAGYGQNRAGTTGSAIAQQRFGSGETTYRALGIVHGARADLPGAVRRDDIDRGVVCFACVYPYPTARAQGAFAERMLVGLFADTFYDAGGNSQIGVWFGRDRFRLLENLTGFQETSRALSGVTGRGDLIEQVNATDSVGFTSRFLTAPMHPLPNVTAAIELGSDGRLDHIDQGQSLLDAAVRNEIWDQRVDASIDGGDLGAFADVDVSFSHRLRTRIGMRADLLGYVVLDRLGNFAPAYRPQDRTIPGFRRSSMGVALGPRATAEYRLLDGVTLLSSYGEGYRSPQARTLEDGEQAPFTRVRSADGGVRFELQQQLRVTLAGYYTHLSDDVAFDSSEGRLERVGATRRVGGVVHVLSRPADWAVAAVSATYADATLLDPPPPTAEEPSPPFERGQKLPQVPPVLVRADGAVKFPLLRGLAGGDLRGTAGTGVSFLSARPLPYGEFSKPVLLWDASVGVGWNVLDLSLDAYNVLDSEYAEHEDAYPSSWDPSGVRPRVPERHVFAGPPRAFLLQLGVLL
jgi:TonB family protein